MSTVWFVLQKPIASLWRSIETANWERLCATLFGFNQAEIYVDRHDRLMRDPTAYDSAGERSRVMGGTTYRLPNETMMLVPEPILSHRLAHIALSCMRYLHRQHPNNPLMQGNLLSARAKKSKQSPWLWRHRLRVTPLGRRQTTWDYNNGLKYPFSQNLRRSHQMSYSEGIQSEHLYQKRHIFYMWTLDLLYHTLRAAMKSDMLTKALSKPFIPSAACILFPLRIKRVQEAVGAYLEKVGRRACSDLRTPTDIYLYVDSSIRQVWMCQE